MRQPHATILAKQPPHIRLRVLASLLTWCSSLEHPPDLRLARRADALLSVFAHGEGEGEVLADRTSQLAVRNCLVTPLIERGMGLNGWKPACSHGPSEASFT